MDRNIESTSGGDFSACSSRQKIGAERAWCLEEAVLSLEAPLDSAWKVSLPLG